MTNYDIDSALAVMHTAGVANVGLAIILRQLPFALGAAAPFCIATVVAARARGKFPTGLILLMVFVLTLALIVSPISIILVTSALFLPWALADIRRLRRRQPSQRATAPSPFPSTRGDRLAVYTLGVSLAFLTTIGPPPFPPESVTPASGESFTAYVLRQDDRETAVLAVRDHQIVRLPTSSVTRQMCRDDAALAAFPSLASLLASRPSYPDCPAE